MADVGFLTILDLPEIVEIVREAIAAVPDYEREALQERFEAILDRARWKRWERGGH